MPSYCFLLYRDLCVCVCWGAEVVWLVCCVCVCVCSLCVCVCGAIYTYTSSNLVVTYRRLFSAAVHLPSGPVVLIPSFLSDLLSVAHSPRPHRPPLLPAPQSRRATSPRSLTWR